MTQTALILIDIQNDYFAGGRMALPGMESAAAQAARLLAHARARALPVIHIRHIAASDDAPFFRPGTFGSEIHTSVQPAPGEAVVIKGRPNAFVATGLEATLRRTGVTHLLVCGAMSQMCIDASVRAAVDLGFAVTLAEDACAAATVTFNGQRVEAAAVHAAIMAPLASSYATVMTTDQAIAPKRAA